MDLLSVHIPKAAGNAVRRLLVETYGAGVRMLYHDFRPGVDFRREARRSGRVGVLHGHVPLDLLREAHPEARTMVWFRHPVDRLESYHFFWRRQPRHGNPNHDRYLDAGADPEMLAELLQNEVAGYLGATAVEDIDFVGVVERFSDDAERFERWLQDEGLPTRSWTGLRDRWARGLLRAEMRVAPVANRNRARGRLDPDVRARVEAILSDEMAIYERALQARAD